MVAQGSEEEDDIMRRRCTGCEDGGQCGRQGGVMLWAGRCKHRQEVWTLMHEHGTSEDGGARR
ncbi:hypothetical protein E2562_033584 [Oryza meyeriana var. granulata]|uniref:Uncharacterized protein n=1 Tax=Oryza meyeriana var. granulata TaxID=110450 RepID=A0A6G1E4Z2_9ORYZ|nr:hypothetical protein E2562_033584 [Oryza meyeriana var. granulata]